MQDLGRRQPEDMVGCARRRPDRVKDHEAAIEPFAGLGEMSERRYAADCEAGPGADRPGIGLAQRLGRERRGPFKIDLRPARGDEKHHLTGLKPLQNN